MAKSFTYLDLDPTFEANPISGDLMTRLDERPIKFALRSLISTNFYERPFHPEFGGNVVGLLFENTTSNIQTIVEQVIRNSIDNYEPRVDIVSINVSVLEESYSMSVNIYFKIKNTNTIQLIDVIIKRTR